MMYPFGCGHNVTPKPCHQMWFGACPHHFSHLASKALTGSLEDEVHDFLDTLRHLVSDRVLTAAYYTWLAMIGRYTPRGSDLRTRRHDSYPGPIPQHLAHVPGLVETACRAAVARDRANMEAVLGVIADGGDLRATLSFMNSIAATAAVTVTLEDDCTPDHITAYLLLGSGATSGWTAAVLPELVDMVMTHRALATGKGRTEDVVTAFRRILDVDPEDPHPLPVACDLVTRLLAQTLEHNVVVLDGTDMRFIDIASASESDTSAEMMASAWTVRAAHAYGNAAGPQEATAGLQAVARSRGDAFQFAADVITAGTQMIAYNHIGTVDTAGSPG